MRQTMTEKIAQLHMTAGPDRPLRAGDMVSLRPRHVLTHDNTSAVLKKFRALGGSMVTNPHQLVFALDHEIQNTSEENLAKYREIEKFAREQGVAFFPAGTGIGHQVMVSEGFVTPGSLVVASDSHANMYGALGALGTPVVRTDAAAIWATGEFWWQIPPTVQVVLTGRLRKGVTGKDVILTLCALYNHDEALNAAVEFTGPGVAALSMDARFTISNMTTEWGALVGWFPVDDVTLAYLRQRRRSLAARGFHRFTDAELAFWGEYPPRPDARAHYGGRIALNLSDVEPWIAGPDVVQTGAPLAAIEREHIAIHKAYLLSCVNGRGEDLQAAAQVLASKKVAPGVKLYFAAASREIRWAAEVSGVWGTLLEAGAIALPSGCGPCIGLGEGLLEPAEVGISATNRNFKGRMGSRDATVYLASPEVVAASAARGFITGPAISSRPQRYRYTSRSVPAAPATRATVVAGFPARLRGRLVLVPHDNLNTDGIYGKDHTYRELTREEMARVVMANHDPGFASRVLPGDILVGGMNFGTGSSREQAATALLAAGITAVIAGSFSQTYLRNAFNNGLVAIECPGLLECLRARFAERSTPTIIPGAELSIDFEHGTITCAAEVFRFVPLGVVPQSLIVAGGLEPLVRERIALAHAAT